MIYGNAIINRKEPQTYIFEDESGNQITGVYVNKETVFTATDNDVREGLIYASDKGQSVGTKNIPAYHTTEGSKLISAGSSFKLSGLEHYVYTKLQVLICIYNSSMSNSVATEMVVINNKVYAVGSTDAIAEVIIDEENKTIDFGITNNENTPYIIRYFTYREVL